ncbi:MAG: pyridoxamine 5'-phosphate oxidase family protein [Gordonia amarae]
MITAATTFGVDCPPEDMLTVDPVALASMWTRRDEGESPLLMALATTGIDGYPRVRHVLLSEIDGGALYFHTDSRSGKVAELTGSPRACISIPWTTAGRQLSVVGDVRVADDDELRRAYQARTRYLKLLAWLNDAEHAALPVAERRERWAAFDADHETLAAPSTWTGFALTPLDITFWRGDPDGPSQRVRFRRSTSRDEWSAQILPG